MTKPGAPHGVPEPKGSGRALVGRVLAAQCPATSKQTGVRCGQPCVPGARTCHYHGSGSTAARSKAAERLLAAVDPAITELLRIMRHGDTDTARLRAIEAILDRAGHPRGMVIAAMSEAEARAALVAAVLAMRERRADVDEP